MLKRALNIRLFDRADARVGKGCPRRTPAFASIFARVAVTLFVIAICVPSTMLRAQDALEQARRARDGALRALPTDRGIKRYQRGVNEGIDETHDSVLEQSRGLEDKIEGFGAGGGGKGSTLPSRWKYRPSPDPSTGGHPYEPYVPSPYSDTPRDEEPWNDQDYIDHIRGEGNAVLPDDVPVTTERALPPDTENGILFNVEPSGQAEDLGDVRKKVLQLRNGAGS